MKDNVKICIFGTQKTTKDLIKYLIKNNHKIDYLITLRYNNKNNISNIDNTLDNLCIKNNIKIYYVNDYSLRSSQDINFFLNNKFDLGISCSWQRIIDNEILDSFKYGVFGWHGSLYKFPNGRGRSPLNWSIRLGGKKVYHNLFRYNKYVDYGDIFETKIIKIQKYDNIKSLLKKVQAHMNKSSIRLLNSIYNNNLVLKKQYMSSSVVFPKLSEKDGELFPEKMFFNEAKNIVRSCSKPFPGAYINYKNKNIKIWNIKKTLIKKVGPGEVFVIKNKIYIGFIDKTAVCKL